MGPVGIPEMMGILVLALILFGPDKLPELGRTLGRAFQQFRRAKEELRQTFESHMRELEREVNATQQTKSLPPSYPDYSSMRSYPYEQEVTTPAPPEPVPQLPPPAAPSVDGTIARSNGTHALPGPATPAADEQEAEAPHTV